MPEQVLRDHRRVRLELADPPAVGVLELEQPRGRPLDGGVEAGLEPLRRDRHAATLETVSKQVQISRPVVSDGRTGKARAS